MRRTIRADLAALEAAGLESGSSADFRNRAEAMDLLYRAAYRRRLTVLLACPVTT